MLWQQWTGFKEMKVMLREWSLKIIYRQERMPLKKRKELSELMPPLYWHRALMRILPVMIGSIAAANPTEEVVWPCISESLKRGSIAEKLEQAKLQREYRDAKAILDRIPPEILNQLRKESRAVQRDTPEDLRH